MCVNVCIYICVYVIISYFDVSGDRVCEIEVKLIRVAALLPTGVKID